MRREASLNDQKATETDQKARETDQKATKPERDVNYKVPANATPVVSTNGEYIVKNHGKFRVDIYILNKNDGNRFSKRPTGQWDSSRFHPIGPGGEVRVKLSDRGFFAWLHLVDSYPLDKDGREKYTFHSILAVRPVPSTSISE